MQPPIGAAGAKIAVAARWDGFRLVSLGRAALGCAKSGARKFSFFHFSVLYCSVCAAFDFLHSVSQTGRGSNSPSAKCMLRVRPASKKANGALPVEEIMYSFYVWEKIAVAHMIN